MGHNSKIASVTSTGNIISNTVVCGNKALIKAWQTVKSFNLKQLRSSMLVTIITKAIVPSVTAIVTSESAIADPS